MFNLEPGQIRRLSYRLQYYLYFGQRQGQIMQ